MKVALDWSTSLHLAMDPTTITTTNNNKNNNINSNTFGPIDVVLTYAAHISIGRGVAAMGNLRKRAPPCTGGGPLRLCGVRMSLRQLQLQMIQWHSDGLDALPARIWVGPPWPGPSPLLSSCAMSVPSYWTFMWVKEYSWSSLVSPSLLIEPGVGEESVCAFREDKVKKQTTLYFSLLHLLFSSLPPVFSFRVFWKFS